MRLVTRQEFLSEGPRLISADDAVIVKHLFSEDEVRNALALFIASYDCDAEIRRSGSNELYRPNNNRLDIGDYAQVNARFVRTCVDFEWNKSSSFADLFGEIICLRDEFLGIRRLDDYTYCWNGKSLINLPKILHYPEGGGFMCVHHDGYNNDLVPNFLLSVTKRGVDFAEGGVYYQPKGRESEVVDAEVLLDVGDVYLHSSHSQSLEPKRIPHLRRTQ